VPKPGPSPEVLWIPDEPRRTATSGKAIVSLALGVLFVFACLTGIPAILFGRAALRDIDQNKGRLRGRWLAIAGIVLGVFGCLFPIALIVDAMREPNEAARRYQCVNNLKQIALAMHNYHEAYGCLPPAAITDTNGRPLLSWRVAILPFMELNDLYAQFHLDEPWDSPHNRALLDPMPSSFACPSDSAQKSGMTGYQVVIGAETAFTPDFRPLRFEDFTDGVGKTLLVGESHRVVPWTKPEDLHFDKSRPLAGLGSYHDKGFNAAFVDGSVKFLKSTIQESILSALLTRSGNEAFGYNEF
jgi:prepilin-type processing-associated H-X9-DG protein